MKWRDKNSGPELNLRMKPQKAWQCQLKSQGFRLKLPLLLHPTFGERTEPRIILWRSDVYPVWCLLVSVAANLELGGTIINIAILQYHSLQYGHLAIVSFLSCKAKISSLCCLLLSSLSFNYLVSHDSDLSTCWKKLHLGSIKLEQQYKRHSKMNSQPG